MKKLFFFLAICAAATFLTSCSGKKYCYEIKYEYSYKYDNNTKTETKIVTTYDFNTPQGINIMIDQEKELLKADGCYNVKVTKKKIAKSESDCHK